MPSMQQRLAARLREAFAPHYLAVRDDSAAHAGHMGAKPEGETHFHITIHAAAFDTCTRLQRHQRIYQALAAEMPQIHALSIDCRGSDMIPPETTLAEPS